MFFLCSRRNRCGDYYPARSSDATDMISCIEMDFCLGQDSSQIGCHPGRIRILIHFSVKTPSGLRFVCGSCVLLLNLRLSILQRPECIDATRMRDGVSVFIKRVIEDATETDVQQCLSLGERKHGPQNHSCPILEVFRDSEDEGYEYIVLPILLQQSAI